MRKAIDITLAVVMALVIIFAVLLVGVRLVGLTPYTVISGSMTPKIPVGSIIYVTKADAGDIEVDDIITYVTDGGAVVTHRVIEILPDEDNPTVVRYRTKGDANEDADGDPVHINNVLGKRAFHIPVIGYVAFFIQNPPGKYIAICLLIVIVALSFIPNILDSGKPEENQEEKATREMLDELKAMREALAQQLEQEKAEPDASSPPEPPNDDNNC
jgi:signal peptidase